MSERLFFALWPDDQVRDRISSVVEPGVSEAAGKLQRRDQWHVTLVFLGQVASDRIAAVMHAAAHARATPFTLRFDAIEFWRRPHVACLTASMVPAPLGRLVNDLRTALAREGFSIEEREFRPHVTLARKVTGWPESALRDPIDWPVRRFSLVRSVTSAMGSRYEPRDWWNLSIDAH